MAQTNYTPIQLYYSSTASAVPVNTNLASGELAINITDGLLFYKDNAGTVQKIGYKLTPTTAGGTGLTSFTANGVVYASSTSALNTSSALTFDGTYYGLGAVWTTNPMRSTQPQYFQYGAASSALTVASDGAATIQVLRFTSSAVGASFSGGKARGTYAAPLAVASGDTLLNITMQGYGGATARSLVQITGSVDTYTSDSNISSYLAFGVSPSGSAASAEAVRISGATGGVGAVGIGYTSLTSVGNNGLAVLGNVGIGTSSPTRRLTLIGDTTNYGILTSNPSGYGGINLRSNTITSQVWSFIAQDNGANSDLLLYGGASAGTKLTIDSSGNLGIGTSSPAYKLDVNGTARFNNTFDFGAGQSITSGSGSYRAAKFGAASGAYNVLFSGSTALSINDNADTINLLVMTNGGNLGLGVTPSAWFSGYKALETGSGSLVYPGSATNTQLWNNLYVNAAGNVTYKSTGIGGLYSIGGGGNAHTWYYAASGTAGTTATLTQAMTLDASGNLGVGTTSPVSRLEIKNTTDNTALTVTSSYEASLQLVNGGGSEVSVINAGGSNILSLRTANTERARIDSSGRLLLGTTSAVGQLTIVTSPTATARSVSYSATGGTIDYYIVNGSNTGSISTNTTTTSYVTSSDYRLKNSIAPMTGALAKVAQLKPVTYKWNTDGSDGEGFIAHELAEVVPQCVTGAKDAVDADGKPVYQGIDTSFLVATLTAAIQEQQAIIQSLNARITALEGA